MTPAGVFFIAVAGGCGKIVGFCQQAQLGTKFHVAAAGDIPLVTPATMSPTYKQGQVRDAMITHLPLFSFGHHSHKGCAGYAQPMQALADASRALPDLRVSGHPSPLGCAGYTRRFQGNALVSRAMPDRFDDKRSLCLHYIE